MKIVRLFINLFQFNRTNWKALSLCFIAASVFWIFNAFNKAHTANLRFPVQFVFDEERYTATSKLPSSLRINVEGSGWELFRRSLGFGQTPLLISLDNPVEIKKIVPNSLIPSLQEQLGSLKVNYITGDTIKLALDDVGMKEIHLKVNESEILFRDGYGFAGQPEVKPDRILITGSKKVLEKLGDTLSIYIPKQPLNANFEKELEVGVNSELVKRTPPLVTVKIPVSEIRISDQKVKVEITNETSFKVSCDDSVKVSIAVPIHKVKEFSEAINLAKASVICRSEKKMTAKVLPFVLGLPDYARIAAIDSVTIKVN